jgi:DNA-binding NtrC family response regulator
MDEMGYEAITTSDPEEALSLVRTGRSRLVLADVNMPGMNGYEFLDRALRCDPGIHVIVMTGEYTLESALDAIRRGATDFLPKPIERAAGGVDGNRERAGGPGHSQHQSGKPAEAGDLQLLGNGGYAAREPAVWACARLIYRGDGYQAGSF